ncbi:MAG: sigma-70 family RNA polymerase sigma factor, partial [Pseudomonadota bacterium]
PSPTAQKQPQGTTDSRLATLLSRIVRQDKNAFELFYDTTVSRVYGLAMRVTRRHELAEEVVCDVYLQVWRQAQRYDPSRGPVMAWLMILGRSRALDLLRREQKSAPDESYSTEIRNAERPAHTGDVIAAVQHNSTLHSALKTLDNHQRQLLSLAFFKGYSHSELANFTGLPLGTVKTQLRRAMITLKKQLTGIRETGVAK